MANDGSSLFGSDPLDPCELGPAGPKGCGEQDAAAAAVGELFGRGIGRQTLGDAVIGSPDPLDDQMYDLLSDVMVLNDVEDPAAPPPAKGVEPGLRCDAPQQQAISDATCNHDPSPATSRCELVSHPRPHSTGGMMPSPFSQHQPFEVAAAAAASFVFGAAMQHEPTQQQGSHLPGFDPRLSEGPDGHLASMRRHRSMPVPMMRGGGPSGPGYPPSYPPHPYHPHMPSGRPMVAPHSMDLHHMSPSDGHYYYPPPRGVPASMQRPRSHSPQRPPAPWPIPPPPPGYLPPSRLSRHPPTHHPYAAPDGSDPRMMMPSASVGGAVSGGLPPAGPSGSHSAAAPSSSAGGGGLDVASMSMSQGHTQSPSRSQAIPGAATWPLRGGPTPSDLSLDTSGSAGMARPQSAPQQQRQATSQLSTDDATSGQHGGTSSAGESPLNLKTHPKPPLHPKSLHTCYVWAARKQVTLLPRVFSKPRHAHAGHPYTLGKPFCGGALPRRPPKPRRHSP